MHAFKTFFFLSRVIADRSAVFFFFMDVSILGRARQRRFWDGSLVRCEMAQIHTHGLGLVPSFKKDTIKSLHGTSSHPG